MLGAESGPQDDHLKPARRNSIADRSHLDIAKSLSPGAGSRCRVEVPGPGSNGGQMIKVGFPSSRKPAFYLQFRVGTAGFEPTTP